MRDVGLTLAWVLASVFLAAGFGKLVSRPSLADVALSTAEIALAALLVLQVMTRAVAATALLVGSSYVVYSFSAWARTGCRCFGDRLPSTGRRLQRVRNLTLWLVAAGYAATTLRIGQGRPTTIAVDLASGIMLGCAIVAGPWVVDWVLGAA